MPLAPPRIVRLRPCGTGIPTALAGRITLAFRLVRDRATYRPTDVAIVDSTLNAAAAQEIAISFDGARFVGGFGADMDATRWTQSVAFTSNGDRTQSTFGALRPMRQVGADSTLED